MSGGAGTEDRQAMERPELPQGLPENLDAKKEEARLWFEALRDRLCQAFEGLEDEFGSDESMPAGRFERTPWERGDNGGGGTMSMLQKTIELMKKETCTELMPEMIPALLTVSALN